MEIFDIFKMEDILKNNGNQAFDGINFHSMKKKLLKTMGAVNCLVTNVH